MPLSKEQLTERFVELVEGINQQFHSRPPGEGVEWPELELTMPQMRILCLLRQGPQRMGNIAGDLGSSLSSATSIVERLVEKGLVERVPVPEDRRVVLCRLTGKGTGEVERFWRIERQSIVEMVKPLTAAQLQTVVQALELLYQSAVSNQPSEFSTAQSGAGPGLTADNQQSAVSRQPSAPTTSLGRGLTADRLKADGLTP
ncbi:MAG: MarR family transcriptional regulator [Dehalococcoidia bacterium]|nr:MarR family transcriptional regulator [Dehalococcoidia bacterium]MSQ16937.1 MarR family transcriptional regulator [Dehalococcoidia bacterium]